ncbi:cytochrome P450 3A8-like isoform X1 [Centruroides sculpturatus]|uniref:cytochrome P450 3A8-like isoform X1 n=1 Tax=Centruroides sculpturatus TaxID=218467 RepID=UPI000C6E0363|nr:cytochrome P450 3A8-like isoform X1 [Centruroides sculpturatus]
MIDLYKRNGRIFGTGYPEPNLWISEPELLKYILVKDFHIFRNRIKFEFGDPMLDKMLSVLTNEDWKRIRNFMSPAFTSSKIRKMTYLVKQCTETLCKHFEEMAEKGEEFDCKKYMSAFIIDVIASTAFATKLNAQENENSEFVKYARMVSNRDFPKLKLLAFLIAPKIVRYFKIEIFPRKVLDYFRNVILKILEERKEKKIRGNDFLQLMMDAQEGILENSTEDLKEASNEINNYQVQHKHKTMTIDEIVAQSILFFIAGHDTTTTVLTYFCYQMALNPKLQEKLLREIDETWQQYGDINFDILSKMPYLDAVLNETLRIQNPAVMLTRVAAEDYILPNTGIKIKKGISVVMPVYGMHHDSEWFPEPEKFNPERFLPENRNLIQPFSFLPFGDGPRHCIGMRYINMVMKLGIVHLLRNMRLVATDETMVNN